MTALGPSRIRTGGYIVEISQKRGLFDALAHEVLKSIREAGIPGVQEVCVAQLYRFRGRVHRDQVRRIAEEILLDRIAQVYSIEAGKRSPGDCFIADVWYKEGVTDTVADTARRAVKDLGIRGDVRISTGFRYRVRGTLDPGAMDLVCRRILANTLVQDYAVALPASRASGGSRAGKRTLRKNTWKTGRRG